MGWQRPFPRKAGGRPRQRHIHAGERRLVRIGKQRGLALVQRRRHRRAHLVQQLPDARLVLLAHVLHPLAQRRQRALLAEILDARLLHRRLIRGSGDGGDGFGAELIELCIHVGEMSRGDCRWRVPAQGRKSESPAPTRTRALRILKLLKHDPAVHPRRLRIAPGFLCTMNSTRNIEFA